TGTGQAQLSATRKPGHGASRGVPQESRPERASGRRGTALRVAVHRAAPAPLTPAQVTRELLARMGHGGGFWIAVLVLGLLALAGLVRLYLMVMAGPEPRDKWGYAAAVT